jgi:4-amino-4-deoxy-L-arabinose transferase-like glycosyltransferase
LNRAVSTVAAVLLALLAAWVVYDHTREDALSADEPIHILSGYFAVAKRTAIVNIEHPPLMKVLSGLALSTLPLAPPPEKVPMGNLFVGYGPEFFYGNRVPPDRILAVARAPFLGVLAGLLLLVFFAGRERYGAVPALFATALVAFDPNVLAHAGVVHTDLGATFFFLATVLAWDAACRKPSPARVGLAAVCLGLAFTTKFSAVYLIPILLLQTLLSARSADARGRLLGNLGRLIAVGVVSLFVVLAVYAPVTAKMDRNDQKTIIREKVGALGKAPMLADRIASFADVSPPLAHFFGGLASVARQNAVGGGITYLDGRLSTDGFPEYFFVAFGVKSTLAFLGIVLAILAAAVLRRQGLSDEWRLFGIPVLVLFLASIGTTYNIGIRHLLPVYPFLALFGAALFARVWQRHSASPRSAVAAYACLILPVVSAVELARIHPYELSYFNALAGGPAGGAKILTDSNVDWGLDLRRLKAELARRGVRREDLTVSYFGGDNVSYRLGVPDFSAFPYVRGRLVAISVFLLTAGPEFSAYHGDEAMAEAQRRLLGEIARGRPVGRVGHSIYLFELAENVLPGNVLPKRKTP